MINNKVNNKQVKKSHFKIHNYIYNVNKALSYLKMIIISLIFSILIKIGNIKLKDQIELDKLDFYKYYIFTLIILVTLMGLIYFKRNFYLKSVNHSDIYMNIILLTSIFNKIAFIVGKDNFALDFYKYNFLILLFSLISIIIKIIRISNPKDYNFNVVDFSEFLGKDKIKVKNQIQFDDCPSNNDLLNRGTEIDQLYRLINEIKPKTSYTIGIEGTWGSGKTTLINIVFDKLNENKTKDILIKFDPWKYNTEESMLESMIYEIVERIPLGLTKIRTNSIIDTFINDVFHDSAKGIFNYILESTRKKYDSQLMDMINDYLESSGKKIVFVVDNLDRVKNDQIYFVYKAISSILKIDRILYLLLYDLNVVTESLEKLNFNKTYLEKIIQTKITLNNDTDTLKNTVFKSHIKLLEYYKIDLEINRNSKFLNIFTKSKNLRELKLMLNNLSKTLSTKYNKLYYPDLVGIYLIQNRSLELYSLIKDNMNIFVTESRNYISIYLPLSSIPTNESSSDFFDKHSKEDYWNTNKDILEELFPVVKRYNSRENELYYKDPEYEKESYRKMRVSNRDFFDLYFSGDNNTAFDMIELSKSYLDDILKEPIDINKIKKHNIELINLNRNEQYKYTHSLDLYIDDLIGLNVIALINNMFQILPYLDRGIRSFQLDPSMRVNHFIGKLLLKQSDDMFVNIIKEKLDQHQNLYYIKTIRGLINYYFKDNNYNNYYDENKNNNIKSLLEDKLKKIISNFEDVYANEVYVRYSGLVPYYELKDKSINRLKNFYKKILTSENIGKFLYDFTTSGTSNGMYTYYINHIELHKLVPKKTIQTLMDNAVKNFDNKFVFDIYIKSQNKEGLIIKHAVESVDEVILYNDINKFS